MGGSSRKGGLGRTGWAWKFAESPTDPLPCPHPFVRRRGLSGEVGVADGHATDVQALDSGFLGVQRVDDFQATAAEVEVVTGPGWGGQGARGQTNQPSFLPAGKHQDRMPKDFGGWPKESLSVAGPPEGAGGHGHDPVRPKRGDFALQGRQHPQGAADRGGLEFSGHGHAFPQADGVGLFVKDAQDPFPLLGQEQLESIGAEVEHGPANDGGGHPSVKASRSPVGKTFGGPRRKASE